MSSVKHYVPRPHVDLIDPIWLAHYPPGVPAQIDPERHRSLVAFFEHSVLKFADRAAFSNFGTTLSYSDLDRHTRAFAAYLQNTLHLGKGERIAIMLPNVLQYPVAVFGALRAGLVVVNTNPLYTARELAHQLSDANARAIVVFEQFADVLESCLANTPVEHVLVTRIGDMLGFPRSALTNFVAKHVRKLIPRNQLSGARSFKHALAQGESLGFEQVVVEPGDPAFLQYTGGTTGLTKAAVLSHRNMVANVEQTSAWLRPHVRDGQEVIITALPLCHIFALTANCLTFMKIGGLNHLITDPRDLPRLVQTLAKVKFTAITGVNTLFNELLDSPRFRQIDFSSLKISLAGGAALQESVARRWKEVTGTTLIEAYGLTEASPAVCINPLDLAEYNGCIGLPLPSTEVSFRNDQGHAVPPGTAGELWVRGPQVMQSYWKQPKETAVALSADGWLRTGDVGLMQLDGFVRLLDRKKDMVLVSGFSVYPNEIEDAIAEQPGVLEVGVFGVPDRDTGEAVVAAIVRKDPYIGSATIRDHCRAVLTGYKRPKRIFFIERLPKNNIGKVLRRELRAQYVAGRIGAEPVRLKKRRLLRRTLR